MWQSERFKVLGVLAPEFASWSWKTEFRNQNSVISAMVRTQLANASTKGRPNGLAKVSPGFYPHKR
jgi:hypothetical protein